MKVLLIGWYGLENVGADALKEIHLKKLHAEKIYFLSWKKENSTTTPFNFISNLSLLKQVDAIVYGGGDILSKFSDGLIFWLWWCKIAEKMKKKVIFSAVGAKNVGTIDKKLLHYFLKTSQLITVRDEYTKKLLYECLLTCVKKTYDPTVLLKRKNCFFKIPKKSIFIVIHPFFHQKYINSRVTIFSINKFEGFTKSINELHERLSEFKLY